MMKTLASWSPSPYLTVTGVEQNPVITLRQTELVHQAFSSASTGNVAYRPREISNTAGFPRTGSANLIRPADKSFSLTQPVVTSPPGHAHLKLDRRTLDG